MQVNGNMRHEKELNNKIKLRPGGGVNGTQIYARKISQNALCGNVNKSGKWSWIHVPNQINAKI